MHDFFISHSSKDDAWADTIVQILEDAGYTTIVDHRDFQIGTSFIRQMEDAFRNTRYILAIFSENYFAATYPRPEWEAVFNKDPNGEKGLLIPIRVQECELPDLLGTRLYIDLANTTKADCHTVLLQKLGHITPLSGIPSENISAPPTSADDAILLSEFPNVRPPVTDVLKAIERRESSILIKGARETGKSTLLNRSIQQARNQGAKILRTDFSGFPAAVFRSDDALFRAIAADMAEQWDRDIDLNAIWSADLNPNGNFQRFLRRHILNVESEWVVWALDDADCLFSFPFGQSNLGTQVFTLFRSWRNATDSDPNSLWKRLTLLIACINDSYQHITDPNQSPFVPKLTAVLEDLTPEQVALWNQRVGSPLRDSEEITRFVALVGGHPALVWEGLKMLADSVEDLASLERKAQGEAEPFNTHLQSMWHRLALDNDSKAIVRDLLADKAIPSAAWFFRLCDDGILIGDDASSARFRCLLYKNYLEKHSL